VRLIRRDRGEDSSVISPEQEEITGTGRNGAKANKRSTTKVVVCGLTCRLSSRCARVSWWGEIRTLWNEPIAREIGVRRAAQLSVNPRHWTSRPVR